MARVFLVEGPATDLQQSLADHVASVQRRAAKASGVMAFAPRDESRIYIPQGYHDVGRDKFTLDGKVPPGITDGVPAVSAGRLAFDAGPRTVLAVFNNETVPARTWPVKDNHIVVAEFLN